MMTKKQLLKEIKKLCLIKEGGPFTLSSGVKSDYYFDCKKAVLYGPTLKSISKELIKEIEFFNAAPIAVGGLSIGADFLVSSIIQISSTIINGCVVRKKSKDHGSQKVIENSQPEGTKIIVVDDVITTGASTSIACDKLLEIKNEIVGIVCIVDREEGGIEYLKRKYNVPVSFIFKKSDFEKED